MTWHIKNGKSVIDEYLLQLKKIENSFKLDFYYNKTSINIYTEHDDFFITETDKVTVSDNFIIITSVEQQRDIFSTQIINIDKIESIEFRVKEQSIYMTNDKSN